jgi:2-polyprenyl-3-methyl-5-hydroxy-6-metoxy-1,4-benzoquinol methylase
MKSTGKKIFFNLSNLLRFASGKVVKWKNTSGFNVSLISYLQKFSGKDKQIKSAVVDKNIESKGRQKINSDYICIFPSNNLWLHDVHFHDLKSISVNKWNRILGSINRQLILHSNITGLHLVAATSVFDISFECFGHFECIHFRLTSDNPSDLYKDLILYPGEHERRYHISVDCFDTSKPIVFEFNVYGSNIDVWIGEISVEFFDSTDVPLMPRCDENEPSFISEYNKHAVVRDYYFLLSPEPHSQERGLMLLRHINLRAKETIDLGAGCAPMMADMILRKSSGHVDCLVFGEQDAVQAKRALNEYGQRVNVFPGDLERITSIPDKKYDQILLIDVLEHVKDDSLVLENIKKLFHKDSKLIISVPNINYKHTFSEEFHDLVGHLRDGYSIEILRKKLETLGYCVHCSVNYSAQTKYFYRFWYSEVKAWSNSFKYTQTAFNEAYKFLMQLNDSESLESSDVSSQGVSHLFVCTLIQ